VTFLCFGAHNCSLTISPLRDATGKIIGASTIARDITERKQLEEKLRESERRFRALIGKSSDAIVLIGMDASVLYASASTTHLLGYAPEELLMQKKVLVKVAQTPD